MRGAKSAWLPSICHVRSEVCIARIHAQSKFVDFALHMEGNNADFALHIEGSNADFAPHMERRHGFRVQKIAEIAISVNFLKDFFEKPIFKEFI